MFFKKKTANSQSLSEDKKIISNFQKSLSQCSSYLVQGRIVTNKELCSLLDPLHEKILKTEFPSGLIDSRAYASEMKKILLNADFLVGHIYRLDYGNDSYAKALEKSLSNPEFIRPLSARQASRAGAVLTLLSKQDFGYAFHELYDTIDDWGFQYKLFDGKYKSISCNEAVLFHLLFVLFIYHLDAQFPELKDETMFT